MKRILLSVLLLAAPLHVCAAQAVELHETMIVHKDPNCGCCSAWAEAMEEAGFDVKVSERSDMDAVKREAGIPMGFEGCHTATIAGYTLEGHVPLEAIRQLLADKPEDVRGLATPGMPSGSLGMGVDPEAAYTVYAFNPSSAPRAYMEIKDNQIVD